LNKYIYFRGYANPQEIFDNHDISLTQIREETRVVRESLLAGMPLVVGETSAPYTSYKAGFRDVGAYADEIERCCLDIRDEVKRRHIMQTNREYALKIFDIKRNSKPIFECFERIMSEGEMKEKTPDYWAKAKFKVDGPPQIKPDENSFKTKILVCSVDKHKKPKGSKEDFYYLHYKDILQMHKKEDYIEDYTINEKYPENYFNYIYVDYLDIVPETVRELLLKYFNKIIKEEGNIIQSKIEINV
jgi:hypothetical protein